MKLGTKILISQTPLVAALALVCAVGGWTATQLGARPNVILGENFRSIAAAETMRETLDRIDRTVLLTLLQSKPMALPGQEWIEQFEASLTIQERNITEVGEQEATQILRQRWVEYRDALSRFESVGANAPPLTLYLEQLQPAREYLHRAINEILTINHDFMQLKSERARRTSRSLVELMLAVSAGACVLGLLLSASLTRRMLRPLSVLNQTVRRLAKGDFDARVWLPGNDEVSELAAEVNVMVDRLAEYRSSSLGELVEAQQASQAAIDSLRDPVVVYDLDGGILIANQSARGMRGLGLEILGPGETRFSDSALEQALEDIRSHVLSGRGPFMPQDLDEAVLLQTEAGERWLLPHAAPLYGPRGAVKGVTVVLQDVTRLHRFAQFKTDLVATAAHEFRTPLTSLQMAVHLCLEGTVGPLTEKQLDLLFAARGDCERLQSLVDELLTLSRLEGGAVSLDRHGIAAEDLVRHFVEAQASAARAKGVDLQSDVEADGTMIAADFDRIRHVFDNLIANALVHTRKGGNIRVSSKKSGEFVRFEVNDTGEGIPEPYLHRVFDKFFRLPGTERGGTGLGLTIAREIVRGHGGEIGVSSQLGKGSTFWFTIPVWHEAAVPQNDVELPSVTTVGDTSGNPV